MSFDDYNKSLVDDDVVNNQFDDMEIKIVDESGDFDEDDSLVTLPDVTLLTHADLAQMPLFKKAEAEWDRAYERHQVMLANKAAQDEFHYEVPPELAPLVFFVSKQEDTAHSLSEGAYKF